MTKRKTVRHGDEVKDKITGFQGIVVAITEFIIGCRRITLAPPARDDGTVPDERSFDEPQLEIINPGKVIIEEDIPKKKPKKKGGVQKYRITRNKVPARR